MVLAICDSSFVSLPEVNDVLLMTFAVNEPESMVKFAILTTLGSVIGCSLLYAVGRKGGDAFLRMCIARNPEQTEDAARRIAVALARS